MELQALVGRQSCPALHGPSSQIAAASSTHPDRGPVHQTHLLLTLSAGESAFEAIVVCSHGRTGVF